MIEQIISLNNTTISVISIEISQALEKWNRDISSSFSVFLMKTNIDEITAISSETMDIILLIVFGIKAKIPYNSHAQPVTV